MAHKASADKYRSAEKQYESDIRIISLNAASWHKKKVILEIVAELALNARK
jgi:hypothetical protein